MKRFRMRRESKSVQLNFRVTSSFRERFEALAMSRRLTLVEMLEEAIEVCEARQKPVAKPAAPNWDWLVQ